MNKATSKLNVLSWNKTVGGALHCGPVSYFTDSRFQQIEDKGQISTNRQGRIEKREHFFNKVESFNIGDVIFVCIQNCHSLLYMRY